MPPSKDMTGETFRGLVLQLRGRMGLMQRVLAARIGVHVTSIRGWEAGTTYPGVASLQALIAVGLHASGFTAGRERQEAEALWAAALRDAPRFRMPFDAAWFDGLSAVRGARVQDATASAVAAPSSALLTPGRARRESWGEAPDIAGFLGRAPEREKLRQWVLDEGSRLVASSGDDGTVRRWDAEGGRPLATLHGHSGGILAVALSRDGQLVASGGDDGTVRLWEASTGALRSVLRVERRFEALDITGLTGVTDAQRRTLLTLGAIERRAQTTPSA